MLGAAALTAASVSAAGQRGDTRAKPADDDDKPRLTLKAQPTVSVSPARIVLTAELTGGANDYRDYYCPTVVWAWGDETESESTFDCEPYVAGKSDIKRRFTVEHVFRRPGAQRVIFRLKRNDKVLATAQVTIQVTPGAADAN